MDLYLPAASGLKVVDGHGAEDEACALEKIEGASPCGMMPVSTGYSPTGK
ncbi:hypothetical protein ALP26_103507 [Pseudomonas savastanoi pv. glycinea]|uniref:Uncharacterized protein n=1 Tax=Pseudomonas savastanoi pv. glycinea TaxID=318 RepID=A0A0P9S1B9_PSESG|nr:Unknown protein sequence [Pseudomonas savastanoi pv. glycinea]KPC44343.1 Unknown protein sequence [Pseudomonas savastanoi pv. glycinea]KPC50902.1 Unknown protein sequence [Pseudomonas savastanoi pv. glycinea]KPX50061.1 hypothetical protein ALO37_102707 [Pseudomonas savastanoi pv. glycinea]RMM97242.1 hypothetical protein ALQ67_103496 [Pseudomonas savastanoi pv. glycinea]